MGKKFYSEAFKLEALKLVRERGISIAQAAREIGVRQQTLQRWKQQQSEGKQLAAPAVSRSQSRELERLRHENVESCSRKLMSATRLRPEYKLPGSSNAVSSARRR